MKYPALNALAKRAAELEFSGPLTDDEINLIGLIQSGNVRPKNLCLLPSGIDWAVRFYVGGAIRTFGLFPEAKFTEAVRFTDMVRLRFWKYRSRTSAANPIPVEANTNLTPHRTKIDSVSEFDYMGVLDEMEKLLLADEIIEDDDTRESKQRAGFLHARRTLKDTILTCFRDLKDRQNSVITIVDESLKATDGRIEKLYRDQMAEIKSLRAEVAETKALLVKLIDINTKGA